MPVNWSGTVYPTGAVPGQAAPIANRFVGRQDGGHPTTGTFNVGDWTIDVTGSTIWICTVAGTPGTWSDISGTNAVSSVFGRTGAVVATSGDYTAAQVTNAADKSSGSDQDFTGQISAPAVEVNGGTGAVLPIRWVGGNASGAPASGTWEARDGVINTDGTMFGCTAGGTPGTWVQVGGSTALTTATAVLGSDLAVSATTQTVVLSLASLAAGTWLVSGNATVLCATTSTLAILAHSAAASTAFCSSAANPVNSAANSICLPMTVVVLGSTTTLDMVIFSGASSTVEKLTQTTSYGAATSMSAVKVA